MKIAHIADLHIRKYKRHEEYKKVFQNLYTSLRENEVDIITVLGDIVHSKTDLSPELVKMVSDFFVELSTIAPTITILGNHDTITNQPTRLDSISPIVEKLKIDNFKLFLKSQIYDFNEKIKFGIFAIDDQNNYPVDFKREPGIIYIALFHGALHNSITDANFKIKSKVTIDIFDKYDYAFLGDIHKYQISRFDRYGNPNAGFSGSLTQGNFGESLEKGYVIWDIDSKKHSFIKVHNDYGYYTFYINGESGIDSFGKKKDKNIPKNVYVRAIVSNFNRNNVVKLNQLSSLIKDLYNPLSLSIEVEDEDKKDIKLGNIKLEDISDKQTQENLLKEYLKNNNIDKLDTEKLLTISENLYDSVVVEDSKLYRSYEWNIQRMVFNNTFSYGENNAINFSRLKGLVGIFSKNASGKSSIVSTLLNGIFNASTRVSRNNIADIINTHKNDASIEIFFIMNKKRFVIERKIVRNEVDFSRARNFVKLYEFVEGEKVDISGDSNVNNTEKMIRDMVGSYHEHTMTVFGQQSDLASFININQSQRKEMLSKFLGLNIFDSYHKFIKEENSATKQLLKQYRANEYDLLYNKYVTDRYTLNDEITKLKSLRKIKNDSLEEINERVKSLNNTIKNISDSQYNPDQIKKDLEETDARVYKIESLLNSDMQRDISIQKKIDKNKDCLDILINKNNFELIKNRTENLTKDNNQLVDLKNDLKIAKKDLDVHTKMTDVLKKHDWFLESELCKKCTFLSEAFKSKNMIPNLQIEFNQLKTTHKKLENKIVESNEYKKIFYEVKDLDISIKEYENELKLVKLSINKNEESKKFSQQTLQVLKDKLDHYNNNKDDIEKNKKIIDEINNLEKNVKEYKTSIDEISNNLYIKNNELGVIEEKIRNIEEAIQNLQNLEEKYRLYSILLDAFSRDGISSSIMATIVPKINEEIRRILSTIVEFDVYLEFSENQDLLIYIDDGKKRKIELSSGMESTVASIAIRAALANVSFLPKSSLFIIDEGFSYLDSDNLNSINLLLGYLRNSFKTVLIISHIDWMTDICDHVISINKENGFSQIIVRE